MFAYMYVIVDCYHTYLYSCVRCVVPHTMVRQRGRTLLFVFLGEIVRIELISGDKIIWDVFVVSFGDLALQDLSKICPT